MSFQRITAAIREINEAVGTYQNEAICQIVDDKSSENDDMSSLSSRQSSRQSSKLHGEHINHFPFLVHHSNEQVIPSPQNMNDKGKNEFINNLISSGDWEALATETAIYQSDASSASSNAQLTVSSSSTERVPDARKRSFLDYVVGRHTLASIAASAAIDNQINGKSVNHSCTIYCCDQNYLKHASSLTGQELEKQDSQKSGSPLHSSRIDGTI